jgi:hypothetical protein
VAHGARPRHLLTREVGPQVARLEAVQDKSRVAADDVEAVVALVLVEEIVKTTPVHQGDELLTHSLELDRNSTSSKEMWCLI